MNKYLKLIFSLLILAQFTGEAKATSLDELYRDIIRNDNQGYLPIFVKNRNQPELLFQDELIPPTQLDKTPEQEKVINLVDERKAKEVAKLAAIKKWQNTIAAVKENRVTPIELEEINKRVLNNDPHAIEILAWMNARGVGTKQDLISAFNLYRQASELGVESANKNAALVYRSMTRLQRESLSELRTKEN